MTHPLELVAIAAADTAATLSAGDAKAADRLPVQVVGERSLAAVLLPRPAHGPWRLLPRARRRRLTEFLVARQQVLERLHTAGPCLPAAGSVVMDPATIRAMLRGEGLRLTQALADAADLDQVQITVDWDPAQVLARFRDSAELAPIARGPGPVTPAALLTAIGALRSRLAAEFRHRLAQNARDSIDMPGQGEAAVLNLVLAVPRAEMFALDTALEAIDATWTEGLRIRMIGPGPLTAFAAVEVGVMDAAAVDAARTLLETAPGASAEEVEAARRHTLRQTAAPGGPRPEAVNDAAALLTAARRQSVGTDQPVAMVSFRREDAAEPRQAPTPLGSAA